MFKILCCKHLCGVVLGYLRFKIKFSWKCIMYGMYCVKEEEKEETNNEYSLRGRINKWRMGCHISKY